MTAIRTTSLTGAILLGFTAASHGAIIAQYAFSDYAGGGAFGPNGLLPTTKDANVIGGAVTNPAGSTMTGANNGHWASMPFMTILGTSGNPNQAYFEFTLTASPGYELDLTDFTFTGGPASNSSVRGYNLHTRIGASDVSVLSGNFPTDPYRSKSGSAPMPTYSVNLSGSVYQDLQSITFRMFFTTPTTNQSVDFDNLTVNGTVSPVPEPTALGLAALGGMLLRRRR